MEDKKPWGIELNTFCMLFHLSQFASFVIPGAGIVLPIVMWATNKDDFPILNDHGRNLLNWAITLIIYGLISVALMWIYVGFVTLFALIIINIAFAIMGAVKANDGLVWHYPLAIKFFK